jgi:hypothetical protein
MLSITPLFVDVIDRAPTCPRACADQRAFAPTDQAAGSGANRRADSNSLRRFRFSRLRIVVTAPTVVDRFSRNGGHREEANKNQQGNQALNATLEH